MAANKSWLRRTAQRLADRLDRLRNNLDALREKLRDSVAESIGQTVAYAVHDAVHAVLGERNSNPHQVPFSRSRDQQEFSSYWQEPQNARWMEPDDDWQDGREEEALPATTEEAEPSGKELSQAVALGCETAAWWLHRWKSRYAIVVATCLGLAASVVALNSGSLTIAGLSLAHSIAHLFSFSDTLQAGTSILAPFGQS